MGAAELLDVLRSPSAFDELGGAGGGAARVRVTPDDPSPSEAVIACSRILPCVIVVDSGSSAVGASWLALADVVVDDEQGLVDVLATIGAHPQASTALALLLRGAETRTVAEGLVAESAVYSTLQAGPEFHRWRADHPPRDRAEPPGPAVEARRTDDRLDIVLSRPHVRNALDTRMRDGLTEALGIALADESVTSVHLRGAGEAFCSGGDLDEFGTLPDPTSGHLVRLTRSIGHALDRIRDRVTTHLHGACFGSGIELAAFGATVLAREDTVIGLPEVGLGLVPGAGGTVSLPRRIGRHRTAWLALTGRTIDAPTALEWGLVDAIESVGSAGIEPATKRL